MCTHRVVHLAAAGAAGRLAWESAGRAPSYVDAARRVRRCRWQDQPALCGPRGASTEDARGGQPGPWRRSELLCDGDPRPLRIPARERRTSARACATCSSSVRACARTSCTSSLVLLRRRGIAARYVSGYLWAAPVARATGPTRWRSIRTRGSRRCCPGTNGTRRAGVGPAPIPRTAAWRARRHVKIGHGALLRGHHRRSRASSMGGAKSELTGGRDDVPA